MSAQKGLGILTIVLALVVGIVPAYYNCLHDGKALTVGSSSAMGAMSMGGTPGTGTAAAATTVPMKCFWTSRAAIATALPLGLLGLFLVFSRRKETNRALAAMGVMLGFLTMALPTFLIGVCADPAASCNAVMKPTLLLAGGLTILASFASLALGERRGEAVA